MLYITASTYKNPSNRPQLIFDLCVPSTLCLVNTVLPIFVIDSGASLPMCYQPEVFHNLVPDNTPIYLGDGNVIYARGRGSIGILDNVYYVPSLKFNLMSVAYLNQLGFSVTFQSNGEVIMSHSNSHGQYTLGSYQNGLFHTVPNIFKMYPNPSNSSFSLSAINTFDTNYALNSRKGSDINCEELIHGRFAHVNDQYIHISIKNNLVSGIPCKCKFPFHSPFCSSCALAKATRVSSSSTPGSAHNTARNKPLPSSPSPSSIKRSNPQDTRLNESNFFPAQSSKRVRFSDIVTIHPSNNESNAKYPSQSPPTSTSPSSNPIAAPLHSDPTAPAPPNTRFAVDLKGPFDVDKSGSAKKYCILFTCTTTRMRYVGFLKTKDEAVSFTEYLIKYLRSRNTSIQSFEQFTDNQDPNNFFTNNINQLLSINNIKALPRPFSELKSDCGGEFVNVDMSTMLGDLGVFHSTTSPYSPHQNGIAERSNRTIFELATACMHACGLAVKWWTFAVAYVVHTLNHLPNRALNLKSTPYIEINHIVPDVSYFRTFGCDAYMVLPENKQPSFGLRAVKGIFVGYNHPNSLSYKVLYRGTVYDTGHVYFNEDLKSLPKPSEELVTSLQSFFNNIYAPQQSDLDMESISHSRDVNDKTARSADDSSNRRIEEIEIDEPATPIATRTRGRTQQALQQHIANTALNTYSVRFFDLSNPTSVTALSSNTHYFDLTCDVEYLTAYEQQLIQSLMPRTFAFISLDSVSVEEAMASQEWPQWQEAMQLELSKLNSINTWNLIDQLPPGRKALLYKWVLRKKYDIYNKLIYKARLTVKGCSQRPGIDFDETFSPVAKLSAVRLLLSLGVVENLIFRQFDVENAFPNAKLDEDIFMYTPKELKADELFMKLNRALYGLKQASREWNKLITKTLLDIGFTRLVSESCIFIYRKDGKIILLALYVDDMVIGVNHINVSDWLFEQLSKSFKLKQNILTRCLGLNINHNLVKRSVTLSRNDYTDSLLIEFGHFISHIPFTSTILPSVQLSLTDCPTTETDIKKMSELPYRSILGKLNYYTCTLRVDINFGVNYLARFMTNPGIKHWNALLHLLAYIRDHPYASITYKDPSELYFTINGKAYYMERNRIYCFVDADFASSDPDKRRSVTGWIIFFNGGIINWKSSLQRRTSASSTEAEYRALHDACKECIWLTRILAELGYLHTSPIVIFEDNTSTISATENPVSHSKLLHLESMYHQIKDFIADNQVIITHVDSEHQLADLLTKNQPSSRHQFLTNHIIQIIPNHFAQTSFG